MREVKIYTTNVCPYCVQAKRLLTQLKVPYEEINLEDKPALRQKLSEENNGYRTVPMIFIDGQFLGGYSELAALHKQGKLIES
jgi:glutaredoxin 3